MTYFVDKEVYSSASLSESTSFLRGLPINLSDLEKLAVAEALRVTGGNRTRAAKLLGISIRTLRNKLDVYRSVVFTEARNRMTDKELLRYAQSHEGDGW